MGLGNGTFAIIPKKSEDENDADGLKTYFAIDFGILFGNFGAIVKKIGAVWDFCGFLFLYRRQPPIFPMGWPYFSMWPYFSTPDHPPLAAASYPNRPEL